MGRILKIYEARFRELLLRAGARKLETGVRRMVANAEKRSHGTAGQEEAELTRTYERLAAHPFLRRQRRYSTEPKFFCDSGLGGLARWLRAAGYEALWRASIDDPELLREAAATSAIVLTTDSIMMERKVLRDGILPALWLPPTLRIREQLAIVFREFELRLQEPRCMACGGELIRREKTELKERLPPKTYVWLQEFFQCRECGKLFWHGTHWQRIQSKLLQIQKE